MSEGGLCLEMLYDERPGPGTAGRLLDLRGDLARTVTSGLAVIRSELRRSLRKRSRRRHYRYWSDRGQSGSYAGKGSMCETTADPSPAAQDDSASECGTCGGPGVVGGWWPTRK